MIVVGGCESSIDQAYMDFLMSSPLYRVVVILTPQWLAQRCYWEAASIPVHPWSHLSQWVRAADVACLLSDVPSDIATIAFTGCLHVYAKDAFRWTRDQMKSVFRAAWCYGRHFTPGAVMRHDPYLQSVREALSARKKKPLHVLLIQRGREASLLHAIDTMCWLLGEYPTHGMYGGSQERCSCTLEFPAGMVATLICATEAHQSDHRFECLGESIIVDNPQQPHCAKRFQEAVHAEMRAFHQRISEKGAGPSLGADHCSAIYQFVEGLRKSQQARL